jgi:hypothetical protein
MPCCDPNYLVQVAYLGGVFASGEEEHAYASRAAAGSIR